MFSDLISLLEFKAEELVLVTSEGNSSFVQQSVLITSLKKGQAVVLVHLAQPWTHWDTIARKNGVCLRTAASEGLFANVDGVSLTAQLLDHPHTCQDAQYNPLLSLFAGPQPSLQALYQQIQGKLNGISGKPVLLIDDLAILVSLGISAQDVYDFVQYCFRLSISVGAVLLVGLQEFDQDDENLSQLYVHLAHLSHISVWVQKLPTGCNRDVHGQIEVIHRAVDILPRVKRMHFKVEEKTVRLFPPGTTPAVL